MAPGSMTTPVLDEKTQVIEKPKSEPVRETWDKKIDFLLSVIGFAVDLGNVWRFPYICYRNGGGAFLIPYFIMLVFAGFPLFYMELALGQYQRCGCLTVWKRICPMLKGIGFGIIIISTYVAWYYNTIISWSVLYFFKSMRKEVPWKTCGNDWNTDKCLNYDNRSEFFANKMSVENYTTPNEEFFEHEILGIKDEDQLGIDNLGPIKWELSLCLFTVFFIVYFAMWKGVKSSGKAVWITATMPYMVLTILLIRGITLPGAWEGIKYFITPKFDRLLDRLVWVDAAAQIFFSLGPGFGVLLALSSYNKFTNNCFRDALLTSGVNCATSLLAGFAVFSVLGHMAYTQNTDVDKVSRDDVGLIFIVYPEAISNLEFSSLWAIIFFFMLITLGLDTTAFLQGIQIQALFMKAISNQEFSSLSAIIFFFMLITLGLDTTFGGLEAIATGILDEWPVLRKRRELFILALMAYCFLGGLATTTKGGIYLVQLLDTYGAPYSILFIVFVEVVAIAWIYGAERFSRDIEEMLGRQPNWYWTFWHICWKFISPLVLLFVFCMTMWLQPEPQYGDYKYPGWSKAIGWLIVFSSLGCVPIYACYKFIITPGSMIERLRTITIPEETPNHNVNGEPVCV